MDGVEDNAGNPWLTGPARPFGVVIVVTANASYAHLLGSVPLADTETVLRAVCAELGPHLRRIPDGETGERLQWVEFQRDMLLNHPDMEEDPDVELG